MNCRNGGNCKKLCNNNDCEICLNFSFESNEKFKYWSEENKIKPRMYFYKVIKNLYLIVINVVIILKDYLVI